MKSGKCGNWKNHSERTIHQTCHWDVTERWDHVGSCSHLAWEVGADYLEKQYCLENKIQFPSQFCEPRSGMTLGKTLDCSDSVFYSKNRAGATEEGRWRVNERRCWQNPAQCLAQGSCWSVLASSASEERFCFHDNFVTFASLVLVPRHVLWGTKAVESNKSAVQRELQSRVSAAQLMFMKNGIYSWAFSRVAYFNNTKQITQKYQHTHTPLKKVFTINFTRSWLNCWKNVEMKSHFWNISSCSETFWCIISIIPFNLEALGRPRVRDWMRKCSSLVSGSIAGYLLGEHLSIPNESSLGNIKKCHLPIWPGGTALSELTIWVLCQLCRQNIFSEAGDALIFFLIYDCKNKFSASFLSTVKWADGGGSFVFSLTSVARHRLCCFCE